MVHRQVGSTGRRPLIGRCRACTHHALRHHRARLPAKRLHQPRPPLVAAPDMVVHITTGAGSTTTRTGGTFPDTALLS